MVGKKRCVVSVISGCDHLQRPRGSHLGREKRKETARGSPRMVVKSKRMDKRSHAWPRGKLIFAVYIFIFYIHFAVSRSPLLSISSKSTDSQTHKQNFKRWKSGFSLSPRSKPFWRGVRRGEFEQKDEMDIVSLRDCLGLSFQGIYIYLFSYHHFYFHFPFNLVSL